MSVTPFHAARNVYLDGKCISDIAFNDHIQMDGLGITISFLSESVEKNEGGIFIAGQNVSEIVLMGSYVDKGSITMLTFLVYFVDIVGGSIYIQHRCNCAECNTEIARIKKASEI